MKTKISLIITAALTAFTVCSSSGEELILEASKDGFFRSNNKSKNNGANPQLLLAGIPFTRSLISFDLSSVTNEIESAEFQFQQENTIRDRQGLSFTVAPMVQTANNAAWVEGQGNLGIKGNPAQDGESTWLRSSFRNVLWESASGKGLSSVVDAELWEQPIVEMKNVAWSEGNLVKIPVEGSLLEKIRNSEIQTLTLGLWGTSGRGFFYISSEESGNPPVLVLQLKEELEEEE